MCSSNPCTSFLCSLSLKIRTFGFKNKSLNLWCCSGTNETLRTSRDLACDETRRKEGEVGTAPAPCFYTVADLPRVVSSVPYSPPLPLKKKTLCLTLSLDLCIYPDSLYSCLRSPEQNRNTHQAEQEQEDDAWLRIDKELLLHTCNPAATGS